MAVHHIRTSLKGLRKNFWNKNMNGWFSLGGRELTNVEAHMMIEFGLAHGCEFDTDIDGDELFKHLGWKEAQL